MTAAVPTTIMKKDMPFQVMSGTKRRAVHIYVECSPAAGNTTDLSSTIANLSSLATVNSNFISVASMPTISGTTVTWTLAGAQSASFIGYYT